MKLLNILFFLFSFILTASSKPIYIKGQVLDSETHQPVSLVSIRTVDVNQTEIAVTDINGNFTLKVNDLTKSIFFVHIAYESFELILGQKNKKNLKIFLHPKIFFLQEITINEKVLLSAKDIIKKVALSLNNNMINTPYLSKAYFQTFRLQNGKYVFFAEAIADYYNSAYSETGFSYSTTKALQYRISDQKITISSLKAYKYPNTHGFFYRYHQILLPVILYQGFTYKCLDTLFIKGQKHLLINYKVNPKIAQKMWNKNSGFLFYPKYYQYGEILINIENMSVRKIINKGVHVTTNVLGSEFVGIFKFKTIKSKQYLTEIIYRHTYKEKSPYSQKYDSFIGSTRVVFNSFNTNTLTKQQIENKFHCKIKTYKYNGKEWYYFLSLPAPKQKVSKYNPNFWRTQPNPNDWNIIKKDLKNLSGIDIEQQFKQNTEYLISKSKFMELRKYADKETRKNMSGIYKELAKNNFFDD